jgi:DNA-binding MarR family transcriptional regulator
MRTFVEDNNRHTELRDRARLGLGVGRVRALLLLKERPLTLTEIADAHGVDAPYATIIVDKLESLGLVERTPHPDDRRRKRVALTSAGREAVVIAEQTFAAPPPALVALSDTELTQLQTLLSRLNPSQTPR